MKTFDLNEFIAFCRAKGTTTYYTTDIEVCALGQFGFRVCDTPEGLNGVPLPVYRAAVHNWSKFTGRFDQLVTRLESLR